MLPDRKKLNSALKASGFGGLDDKTLSLQMAMCVRDHDHFRTILMKVEPDKRHLCYKSISPHLRFKAKALDVYELEAKQAAERNQLPTYDTKTMTVTPFEVGEIDTKLVKTAERIMDSVIVGGKDPGHIKLVCSRCTKEETIPGQTKYLAARLAAKWGWMADVSVNPYQPICPECSTNV